MLGEPAGVREAAQEEQRREAQEAQEEALQAGYADEQHQQQTGMRHAPRGRTSSTQFPAQQSG